MLSISKNSNSIEGFQQQQIVIFVLKNTFDDSIRKKTTKKRNKNIVENKFENSNLIKIKPMYFFGAKNHKQSDVWFEQIEND